MTEIRKHFGTPAGPIATFDFVDIADGIGIVLFFGYTSRDDSAIDYHLARNAIPTPA